MEFKYILKEATGDDEEVILPENVDEIAVGAFRGRKHLRRIAIPKNCTKIDKDAFRNCASLEEVVLHDAVRTIGENCFRSCTSLKRVVLSDSMRTIPQGAFAGCTALEVIEGGQKVEHVGDEAFTNCLALESFCGRPLRRIGSRAFSNCTNLAEIDMGPVVVLIDKLAFRKCENLAAVRFPGTVREIAEKAFFECSPAAVQDDSIIQQFPNAFTREVAEAHGALRPIDEKELIREFQQRHEPDRVEFESHRAKLLAQRDALERRLPNYGILDLKKRDALSAQIDDIEAEVAEIDLLLGEIANPSWQSLVDDFASRQ